MSTRKAPPIRVPLIVHAYDRSLPAELWHREGAHATLWCGEHLAAQARCDVMFEGISEGVPVLAQIVVSERAEPVTHAGRDGHLHLVQLQFVRRADERKLDVWVRAAEAARRGPRDDSPRARPQARAQVQEPAAARSHEVARSPRPAPAAAPAPTAASAPSLKPGRVLLVGEERARARELSDALGALDHQVVVEPLPTLAALRAYLAAARPRLVLLVPDLPDARGMDCLRAVVEQASGVPVVVLRDAEVPRGFDLMCLLAGAARVLRRDSPGDELARRVRGLYGGPARASAPPPALTPEATHAPRVEVAPAPPPGVQPALPAAPVPPRETPPRAAPRVAVQPAAPRPVPAPPQETAAELWWIEEDLAAIWCSEALRIGLRCEMLLDPEERGRADLYRVEIVRAHHKCAPDGRNGFLHEASVWRAPETPAVSAPRPTAHEPPPAPRAGSLFRVVLVEHNPDLAPSALRGVLGRIEGVLIETRGSLAGLRARARRGAMDLVLLELDLPDSAGLDTVRAAVAAVGGVPVVALAVEPSDALAAECAALGVARVLGKDLDHAQAVALLGAFHG